MFKKKRNKDYNYHKALRKLTLVVKVCLRLESPISQTDYCRTCVGCVRVLQRKGVGVRA